MIRNRMLFSWVRVSITSVLAMIICLTSLLAQANPTILAETLRQYFKPMKLLPAVVPSTYKVGDIYEFPSMQLIYRSENCFHELETRNLNISLASGVSEMSWFAELQAKLKSVVGLSIGGSSSKQYIIRFQDAVVIEAARSDLKSALKKECAHFNELLVGGITRPSPLHLPIAKVLIARIELFVVDATKIDVSTEIDSLQSIFGIKATSTLLDTKAALTSGWGGRSGWLLTTNQPVAVAFMPAVVPLRSLSASGGKISPMNPDNPLHAGAFGELSDEMAINIERYYKEPE